MRIFWAGEASPGVNDGGTHSVSVMGPLGGGVTVGAACSVPIDASGPMGVWVGAAGVGLIGVMLHAAAKKPISSAARENRMNWNMLTSINVLSVRREDYSMDKAARLFAATGWVAG